MSIGLSEYEQEFELLGEDEFETEFEDEFESAELFSLGDIGQAIGGAYDAAKRWVTTPSDSRGVALKVAKDVLPKVATAVGGMIPDVGPIAGPVLGGLASAGVSYLPDREYESEFEWETEDEINPIRKIYADAMMEHLAHEAAAAETEQEAVERFLPLVPMMATKLLPAVAKLAPRAARAMPRVARAVTRVTPHLSQGVSKIARRLHHNPRTRYLVRVVPAIARKTVNTVAKQAAAGQPVTPKTAQRTLAKNAYGVLASPQKTQAAVKQNVALDKQYHKASGTPPKPAAPATPKAPATMPGYIPGQMIGGKCVCVACPACGTPAKVPVAAAAQAPAPPAPSYCRCCGQLLR